MFASIALAAMTALSTPNSVLEMHPQDQIFAECPVWQISPVTYRFACTGSTLQKAIIAFMLTHREFVREVGRRSVMIPTATGGRFGFHVMFATDTTWRN